MHNNPGPGNGFPHFTDPDQGNRHAIAAINEHQRSVWQLGAGRQFSMIRIGDDLVPDPFELPFVEKPLSWAWLNRDDRFSSHVLISQTAAPDARLCL